MKCIGLIGGLSWESTIVYYKLINELVREQIGGLHSADCLVYSFDFAEIEALQVSGRWEEATERMIAVAKRLERGGADFLLICSNTMHKMAAQVQASVSIPLLHLADATAELITAQGITKIGLLGTRFTMEEDFYKGRLTSKYGLDVIVPDAEERQLVNRVIYDELCQGVIDLESKQGYIAIMDRLVEAGAQGIILGCTEITLLVNQNDATVPLFDTTAIHAEVAVEYALRAEEIRS
ncbi:MAG: aspartate/glutamate racemase family protein [Anaerolineae bacterium]|nr:aspartate/glutamate racemase family protein [Anaerolineae bacterium]